VPPAVKRSGGKYCEEQIIQWLKEEEIEITLKSFDTGQPK
jgi:hypothetical protein